MAPGWIVALAARYEYCCRIHGWWDGHHDLVNQFVGNIFTIFDANVLSDLLLCCSHEIGGIWYAIIEDVVFQLLT